MDFLRELEWRGLVHDQSAGLPEYLAGGPRVAYAGFDPSADSLHVGSLLPILALARWQRAGHHAIAVVGGGTGLIGDPSGKVAERQLLDRDQVAHNVVGIRRQLERFLDFDARTNPARLVDNHAWLGNLHFIDFLRDVGKHFSVNVMLTRDSVKRRLEGSSGISYTEFSYMLLQAYDFLELHDRHGCTVQMGGSDQWGNIVAGIDLVRRMRGALTHGLTFPLMTTRAGTKFGKTEAGTVWLDPARTSPYAFYQFWLNTDDRDAVNYLRTFTRLDADAIAALERDIAEQPAARSAQKALAREVTRLVHGDEGVISAETVTEVFFGGELGNLSARDVLEVLADAPSSSLALGRLEGEGLPIVDLLVAAGLASSKGDAKRAIEGGGVYLNQRRIDDLNVRVTRAQALDDAVLVLRKGKKSYHLVRLTHET